MVSILKRQGEYVPVIVCDQCGAVIDDAFAALQVSSTAPEGATAQAFHVHKGVCEARLADRIGGLHGSEELSVHLVQLLKNSLAKSDRAGVRDLLKGLE